MSWRIQIADKIDEAGVKKLSQSAAVIEEPSLESISTMDALIVRSGTKVTRQVIQNGQPRLKVVGRAGVGVDNIDLAAAAERGVTVVNAPEALTNAVAEHTLAMMLALARNIVQADNSMKTGHWNKKALKGFELQGRRLGIIGMGRIGRALTAKALALGMEVVASDPPVPNPKIEGTGATSLNLQELLATSDFVSLHVPLAQDTKSMIGPDEIALMKPSAYLISTARGGVVDEVALLNALENDKIAGAALDVFEQEPPGATALVTHPKLIATPHLGSQTAEAQRRAAIEIADEVLAALKGDTLRWKVA